MTILTLRAARGLYYTAGDGQDLSPVCARAGSAAAAEPAGLVAGGSPGVLRERPDRSIGSVGDHDGVRRRGTRLPAVSPGHADEGVGVRLLRRRLFVAEDPAAAGRRRGVPRAGGRQRPGLSDDRRFSQDAPDRLARLLRAGAAIWRANWARRGSAAWRSTAARSRRTRRSTRR